jgi:hypothetical protein
LEQNESVHLDNSDFQAVFLSKTNSSHRETIYLMLRFKTEMDSFGEIHVFLQLSGIGLFVGNIAYVHHESPKLQQVFL